MWSSQVSQLALHCAKEAHDKEKLSLSGFSFSVVSFTKALSWKVI